MLTYTLTFDEFFELYKEGVPKIKYRALCMVAAVSLIAAIDFGLLIETILPSSIDAGSLFALFVLAGFGIPWITLETAEAGRRTAIQNLRRVYQQAYAGERTVSIQDDRIEVETPSGTQILRHTTQIGAYESENVISIANPDQLTLIMPKRILSPNDLTTLRGFSFPEDKDSFEVHVSLREYLFAAMPMLWREHPLLLCTWHICGFVLVAFLANYRREGAAGLPGLWFSIALALILLLLPLLYLVATFENCERTALKRWEVSFLPNGLWLRTIAWQFYNRWNLFTELKETRHSFLIVVNPSSYYIVPKKFVPARQQIEFRQRLRSLNAPT